MAMVANHYLGLQEGRLGTILNTGKEGPLGSLKGKGVQEGWPVLKKEVLKA